MTPSRRDSRPRGFTLVELLVVTAIVVLLTVATLPVILPTLTERRVFEGANLLQASLSAARDAAVRANAPRGIRLLPDPVNPSVSNRIISIEQPPEYSEGFVGPVTSTFVTSQLIDPATGLSRVAVEEQKTDPSTPSPGLPNPPTSWFWNIRQGDQVRFSGSGRTYTIAGPIMLFTHNGRSPRASMNPGQVVNAERFINFGPASTYISVPGSPAVEFLYLTDGVDNDQDGFIDEGFDGINNDNDFDADGNPIIDPGFNGLDDDGDTLVDEPDEILFNGGGEFEQEAISPGVSPQTSYFIIRRPVPSQGAREIGLPSSVVVDMTTLDPSNPASSERSRLPRDPYTGYVDVLLAPSGEVRQAEASSGRASSYNLPVYHFWITERDDVFPPVAQAGVPYLLPMPRGTIGVTTGATYPDPQDSLQRELKSNRRLLTLFPRTGQIVINAIEDFDPSFIHAPYLAAQAGAKEEP